MALTQGKIYTSVVNNIVCIQFCLDFIYLEEMAIYLDPDAVGLGVRIPVRKPTFDKPLRRKSPLLEDVYNLIEEIGKSTELEFRWVPGHVGVENNEKADGEAKAAVVDEDLEVVDLGREMKGTMRKELRKRTLREWQERWDDSEKGRQVFRMVPKVESRNKLVSFITLFKNRFRRVLATRFLSGHPTNVYL
jgi:hypothetical protein